MSFTEQAEIQCCIENHIGQTTEKSKISKCKRKLYGGIGKEKQKQEQIRPFRNDKKGEDIKITTVF